MNEWKSSQHLSDYERQALTEIHQWKNPPETMYTKAMGVVVKTMDNLTDAARAIPGVDWTIDNVIAGLLNLVNEITHDWISTPAIYKQFEKRGHTVLRPGDVFRLDLEHVDGLVSGLPNKFTTIAGIEGAATGYAGAAGILPDIVALTTLNLRAAGEYATYYGFDTTSEYERLYAINILTAASSYSDINKDLAFRPAVRVTKSLAGRQGFEAVGQLAVTRSIKKAVEKLGLNLTKAKLAQLVPATGAVVGGSFNIMYSKTVCTAAHMLYRERFLMERHGGTRALPEGVTNQE